MKFQTDSKILTRAAEIFCGRHRTSFSDSLLRVEAPTQMD